jgi:hypothetical protein
VLAFAEHDVAGLEVPMRDAFLMRRRRCVRDGYPDRQHGFDRQSRSRQRLGQRAPLYQLHRQEDGCARRLDRMESDDVRVVERRHGERLARETLAAIGVDASYVWEQFECDLAPQSLIGFFGSSIVIALPQVVRVHAGSNPCPLSGARALIEAEVNAAVDARRVDIVGDVLERFVLERDTGDGRVRQRDGGKLVAEIRLGHATGGITRRGVC